MSFFSNIKTKPSHVKSRYAFVGAFVLTSTIALVWTTTLPARFGVISDSVDVIDEAAQIKKGFEGVFPEQNEFILDEPSSVRSDTETSYDGALGSLGSEEREGGSGYSPATTTLVSEVIEENLPPQTPDPTVNTINESVVSTTSPPKQAIILIGTTTKKNE